MRFPFSRRAATAVVCAALALGAAAPVAASVHELPRDIGGDTASAPAPDATAPAPVGAPAPAPAKQTKPLDDIGNVLKRVADLIEAALNAPGGELSPADVKKHTEAIRGAVAVLKAAVPADALAHTVATVQKSADSLFKPAAAGDPRQP